MLLDLLFFAAPGSVPSTALAGVFGLLIGSFLNVVIHRVPQMMQRESITVLDTTTKSIEEIATTLLHRAGLQRHAY